MNRFLRKRVGRLISTMIYKRGRKLRVRLIDRRLMELRGIETHVTPSRMTRIDRELIMQNIRREAEQNG